MEWIKHNCDTRSLVQISTTLSEVTKSDFDSTALIAHKFRLRLKTIETLQTPVRNAISTD